MTFTDICILTEDVTTLARFYETIFNVKAQGDSIHSYIQADGTGIAIYSKKAAEMDMLFDFSSYWGSGNITIGFNVDDVDAEYERLQALQVMFITSPKTYPWGAKSVHFRDPDGNIICFRSLVKGEMPIINIKPINDNYRDEVNQILKEEWYCPPSISRGQIINTSLLPGFVALENHSIKGVVTYNILDAQCEIVTLNSFEENKGIGTALVNAVLTVAKENNCNRLWLITTNDDINAIRFYQKKGFELVAFHINAMDTSRQLKPSIPLIGMDNIPIKHEIEFEIRINFSGVF